MATTDDKPEVDTNEEQSQVDSTSTNLETISEAKPEGSKTNGTSSVATEELNKKIVKQIEYYFGNYNLPRDKFLSEQIKLNDGWISVDIMVKFKRLADLSTDHNVIRNALKDSEMMEVDDESDRVRRSLDHPLPSVGEDLRAETVKRTVYCKGFPKDGSVNLDALLEHFKKYGPYETIHMRQFHDNQTKKHGFKGSILIVFPTVEKAKEFMEVDDVQFNKMPLIRKWQEHYLEEKTQEIKERKARKEARIEQLEKESESMDSPIRNEIDPIPRGSFLFASGFPDTTMREDIKTALLQFTGDVAFINFFKGQTEGYIRLSTPFTNVQVAENIGEDLVVNGAKITVRVVQGEEEDEQVSKAEAAKAGLMARSKKRKTAGGGGGGRGRGYNKRRRH